jgi:hypothetical protein
VSGENPCNVTLLKVLDKGEWNCTVIPDEYLPNGTVTFVDGQTGASATPTQNCCERFGYKWNTSTSTCHHKTVSGTIGGNPSEPDGAAAFVKNGGSSENPLPILDSKSISFNGINVTGSQTVFALEGVTTSNTYVTLGIVGQGSPNIPLTPNMVYGVELDIIVIQTGGTSGTVGDVDYLKSTAAVKSVRGSAKPVGNFVNLSTQSEHNHVHGIQFFVAGGGTTQTILRLQVSGQNNHTLQWYVTAKITALSTLKFL